MHDLGFQDLFRMNNRDGGDETYSTILVIIFTPYNYFEWNPKSAFQLKRKALYNLTIAIETKLTSTLEKTRWANHKDEAT
jgi:hypothetical protein